MGGVQVFQRGNKTNYFKSKKLLGQTTVIYSSENCHSIRVFQISHAPCGRAFWQRQDGCSEAFSLRVHACWLPDSYVLKEQ